MSFPDPPPPSHQFMPQPYSGGFWSRYPIENEQPDLVPQFEDHPAFKTPRNSENPPNPTPFQPPNPRVNPINCPVANRTGHIFYKTRICARFTEGTCRNGETCSFAHGAEDLRQPPPNWQELIRERDKGVAGSGVNIGEDQRIIHRMKICKRYYNGEECHYGDKCNFLHERPPAQKITFDEDNNERESSAICIGTTTGVMGSGDSVDGYQSKMIFWKTRLCAKWEVGQCPYGDRCHYAHGASDLKFADKRIEETVINPRPVPAKPIMPPSLFNATPANVVIAAALLKEDGEDKKASRWKLNKKINRIYGDWLDDQSPPYLSPTKEEI